MKFLIKLFCLLSLLSSFSFSADALFFATHHANNYLKKSNVKFLANNKYVMFDRPDDPGHVYVGEVYSSDTYFYAGSLRGYFWEANSGDVYYIGNDVKTGYFVDRGYWGTFTRRYEYSGTYNSSAEFLTYVSIYEFHNRIIATCNSGEEFNTKTLQCVPGCPAGQSWDIENNLCYSDCSDKYLNKFGYPNGTAQGGCVDCSNAFTNDDIASCICAGFGTSLGVKLVFLDPDGPFVSTLCSNGMFITFKKRSNEKSDKEKDKEKDKENPEPDKDKKNDNNSTNSSNKDNSNPDKKDNNENSNNSSGESGNSSNNNSGGTSGNGSSGGGGTGVETKPNPNYNGNGKEEGKQDGKGGEGKGDDAVAGKLDYGNLEKDMKDFKGDYGKAVEDSFSFVNDVKSSLSDTISKIKDGNLMSLKKSNIPASCPLEYKVNLIYFEKDLIFDICKAISPASQTLYYFFYFVFFVLLFLAVIKLFILTFMGW